MSPLILASKSASRRAMLEAAGIPFETAPAALDERAVEASMAGRAPVDVALGLAEAKALSVSSLHPARLVLGSDSLVEVDGRRFDKPRSREDAAAHLRFFSGKALRLHSASALVCDGQVRWRHGSTATLHVIELSAHFIEDYLAHEWPAVAACVGVFRIEGRGVQLFEAIEGDHFTVLGMPLLAVLQGLRELGELGH